MCFNAAGIDFTVIDRPYLSGICEAIGILGLHISQSLSQDIAASSK